MSKESPAPPDYLGAAQATAQSSKDVTQQQTYANRTNVNTPWSQTTYNATPTWDPVTGQYIQQWTQNTNLNPNEQKALDSQQSVQAGLSQTAQGLLGQNQKNISTPIDYNSFQQIGKAPTAQSYAGPQLNTTAGQNANAYYNKAGDAVFQQYQARAQPANERAADQLRTQLYNAGLKEGDQQYDTQMAQLRQSQGDAMTNASLQATQAAGTEAARMQGMDLSAGQFGNSAAEQQFQNQITGGNQSFQQQLASSQYGNQARTQQIQEAMQKQGYTLNQINALLSGQQLQQANPPGTTPAGVAQGANYANAAQNAYQANVNATNVDNANTSGTIGGLASLAMIAAMAA